MQRHRHTERKQGRSKARTRDETRRDKRKRRLAISFRRCISSSLFCSRVLLRRGYCQSSVYLSIYLYPKHPVLSSPSPLGPAFVSFWLPRSSGQVEAPLWKKGESIRDKPNRISCHHKAPPMPMTQHSTQHTRHEKDKRRYANYTPPPPPPKRPPRRKTNKRVAKTPPATSHPINKPTAHPTHIHTHTHAPRRRCRA
jgi:hypothetical protein